MTMVVIGLVIGAAVVGGRILTARRQRLATERRIRNHLPEAIELLVLLLQSGSTPTAALRELTDVVHPVLRPACAGVIHRLDRGQRLADALGELPRHLGVGARPLVDTIATADRYGLELAPVLDSLAAEARAARRRLADADARTLSVKLSFPLVTCILPAFMTTSIIPALAGSVLALRDLG
jgi:tight adherence protein C